MLWKRQAERMQGSHAGSGRAERTAELRRTLETNRREEHVGGKTRRSERTERRGEGKEQAEAQAVQDA